MDKKEIEFLKGITDLQGTSGGENQVRDFLKKEYEKVTDNIQCDGLGSIMALTGDKGPRIMAAGHMDEVGFMVRAITEDGFIKFSRCGYFFVPGALSQHFTIQTDTGEVNALCSLGPGMFKKEFPEIEDLVMDVGCTSREEVRKLGVAVGDFIVPKGNFTQYGFQGKYLVNKAWDNRIGCAVALKVLQQLSEEEHPNTYIAAGSVQEEVGTRGARSLGHLARADIAFSIDVGIADDYHGGAHEGISLGKGPELCFMDSGTISHRKLIKFVAAVAEECNIPYQTAILKHGGTDAEEFQNVLDGTPVLMINVPSRYAHTTTCMIHYDDYINTIRLLKETVKRLDEEAVRKIKGY